MKTLRLARNAHSAAALIGALTVSACLWPVAVLAEEGGAAPIITTPDRGATARPAEAPARPPEPRFIIDAYDVDGNTLLDNTAVESAVAAKVEQLTARFPIYS